MRRTQPHRRRADHPPPRVQARLQGHHPGARRHRPGPQLGTRQIHEDAALDARLLAGPLHVGDHLLPLVRSVMGTVDPRAAHARHQEIAHQAVILRRVAGKRHHDPGVPLHRLGTQQGFRVPLEQLSAAHEVHRRERRDAVRASLVGQAVQRPEDRVEAGQGVRLGAAQCGQPEARQLGLRVLEIGPPERQVVDQVPGAVPKLRVRTLDVLGELLLQRQRLPAHAIQLLDHGEHGGVRKLPTRQGATDLGERGRQAVGNHGPPARCTRRRTKARGTGRNRSGAEGADRGPGASAR